ncbi:plasmid mobilization relaxosome protein MobC [Lactiplantibacillus plantarum]|uniref:hypothetical protein n=3 Tax=Lactiplantibacillus plantarum TaxID=1590 RepID=UPI002238122D|nr:hypothetical protein [Lactiplantibacillus plantarum]MCG0638261.1 plasmid mobilization relaxosome protein MobC [Lactiplantibacillus plantarum]MCG0644351.1 plasmid mobilization relaxosome protein MobC [Lactiplantibacillus plantarum]MCG0653622.1 plasmid mobilization relaxosome protein MobC [Lactiplantibacillus plantarum]MCG0685019.1 plasmid mobilization relaxosome protein MobC [Lactiplantibacillus plantarum]MCG0786596.1 plasmid mobilization relaxosome protein MobC [Lactiplantibacillus plantaru
MCEISNSLKNKLFSLCNSQSINNVAELTQDETNIFWPSSGEFDFLSEKYVITHVVRTCLDTLTFDLILVKLDQKQGFLIHEKLCTPL